MNAEKDFVNNDDGDDSSVDSCLEIINFQSIFDHKNGIETGISCSFDGCRTLQLSTLLEEQDIAPIFSGAEWAGTRVWHAAIRLIDYMYNEKFSKDNIAYSIMNGKSRPSLLELGCGLGVPGMIASLRGATTVLSDQENLLDQLRRNLENNFTTEELFGSNSIIKACTLDWSRENVRALLEENGNKDGFDVVIHCDCVFEPLYGKSWMMLVDVIDELLSFKKNTVVLSSMERRNGDGINNFLQRMNSAPNISFTKLVYEDRANNIQIYESGNTK
mmetsp:Transcript_2160/g.2933  ORF Transcript_2160/g.2933 Transcript_2160/m.2933 type:complete len:274 (-) Transcript_2160:400-1221(-)